MHYMPHIDGLRAIAVLGVIFFHYDILDLQGGFAGVDVFYTISGYLITSIIYFQIQNNKFSFSQFYLRRIRRLIPALVVTTVFVLFISFFLFNPENIIITAESAFYAIFSLSNVYFSSESGYWSSAAEIKPLLHTWSLSVEEQFYLLWPATLLFIASRFSKNRLLKLIILGAIVSLTITYYYTTKYPTYAFYLSPFRAYEFFFGALIVFISKGYLSAISNNFFANTMSIIGLLLVLFSFIFFSNETAFPGVAAAIPCIGTVLIILSPKGFISRVALSNQLIVWIGKISYSLYLVHWPLVAFYRFKNPGELDITTQSYLLLSCFTLAVLLYYLIETPFRTGKNFKFTISNRRFAVILTTMLTTLFTASAYSLINKGKLRHPANQLDKIFSLTMEEINIKRKSSLHKECKQEAGIYCRGEVLNKQNVLIVGDSHGPDGYNITKILYPDAHLQLYSRGGCPPLLNLNNIQYGYKECSSFNDKLWKYLDTLEITDTIIISMRISDARIKPLADVIKNLMLRGFKVKVLGVGPTYNADPRNIAFNSSNYEEAQSSIEPWLKPDLFSLDETAKKVVTQAEAVYLPKLEFYCNDNHCDAFTKDKTELITYDLHHLSYTAATELANHLKSRTK